MTDMNRQTTLLLAAIVLLAANLFRPTLTASEPQLAEAPDVATAANLPGRYQLSTSDSGYYILDSHTGAVWHGYTTQKAKLLTPPLNQ